MGKKVKLGKQRQDKFYKLAKETGFRSRAAFKLIQLNRKYEFLQKSRVLVDLCAAPGGWLQVATQHMPVSSLIIGVDLVPIKPIHNVITIEDDITKSSCKQALQKHLQTWKADVVLHDGAPNVGKNWLHDAFQQAQLTLQALKLATGFLVKGGWFVTKVFRSKDYQALLWVFRQFFKKVYATKPQASRTESAEIFVVCQHFIAPDKIDPKFLDPKFVFEEVEAQPKNKLNMMFPEKQKKSAEGYADGETTMYHTYSAIKFITSLNCIEILNDCSELLLDDEKIANHRLTTNEIKECCKDIKVLGRKELKQLLTWRKKLRDELVESEKDKKKEVKDDEQLEEDEDLKIQREVEELQLEQARELKRKKRKVLKERKELQTKMELKMIIPNAEPISTDEPDLFHLSAIKNKKELGEVEKGDLSMMDTGDYIEDDDDEFFRLPKRKRVAYDKESNYLDGMYSDAEESTDEESLHGDKLEDSSSEDERLHDDEPTMDVNPLVVELDDTNVETLKKRKVDFWFGKDVFDGLENEADEDFEMENISQYYDSKGALVKKENGIKRNEIEKEDKENKENGDEKDDKDEESDDESDYDVNDELGEKVKKEKVENEGWTSGKKMNKKRKKLMDVESLALGSMMIQSKKAEREIIDNAWNKYTFNDEAAPDWFKRDEEFHNRKQIPVTKEMVQEYREKVKELNARPIGKIFEAKARKKRKALKRMEKARKRAENITDAIDMTDREKMQQIKTIYKKAGLNANKKKEVTYVVSRKAFAGKRTRRPAGVKGQYKVVDPRMKKDNMKAKNKEKEMNKGKKGRNIKSRKNAKSQKSKKSKRK